MFIQQFDLVLDKTQLIEQAPEQKAVMWSDLSLQGKFQLRGFGSEMS
jgi:hypothetical protein